jgi:hypothetical protein
MLEVKSSIRVCCFDHIRLVGRAKPLWRVGPGSNAPNGPIGNRLRVIIFYSTANSRTISNADANRGCQSGLQIHSDNCLAWIVCRSASDHFKKSRAWQIVESRTAKNVSQLTPRRASEETIKVCCVMLYVVWSGHVNKRSVNGPAPVAYSYLKSCGAR